MLRVFAIFVLFCLVGCNRSIVKSKSNEPKLKTFLARTDLLLIKRFFDPKIIVLQPPADDIRTYVSSRWTPGNVTIEPLTVVDANEHGTEVKGIRIDLSQNYWTIFADGHEPQVGEKSSDHAFLDNDEIADLDAAIIYMEKTMDSWTSQPPAAHTEVLFASKDGFQASLVAGKEPSVVLEIGSTSVQLDKRRFSDLKNDIQSSMQILKAN